MAKLLLYCVICPEVPSTLLKIATSKNAAPCNILKVAAGSALSKFQLLVSLDLKQSITRMNWHLSHVT